MESERMILARLPPLDSHAHGHRGGKKGQVSPNYQIQGSPVRYTLPPPNMLKPFVDRKAGTLETWPAHATGHNSGTSIGLTKSKELVVINDDDLGKTSIIPKPRFLDQLESFLKKELRSLGVTDVGPNELRLQAHREVFEYLIEDFKTYKPLLSAIKNEYEMMLAYQREHIRQLEPLRQMLVTVSEQCDQKIMSLRDEEKQEIVDLKKENSGLYNRISNMKNDQKELEQQVLKLQEELAVEYQKYRDECDARKLLVSDINDLRYQQEDIAVSKQGMQELEEEEIDPVTLRIALKKAREDEASASKRLYEMEANYGDVIPRRDYEALEKKQKETEENLETSISDFSKLKQEHEALLDVHKEVVAQRDEYYTASETLRRSATPRPDWEKCADYVQGGIVRWKELSENKNSTELVDVLLNEIVGGNVGDMSGAEYFDGRGTEETVPKYLRHEGQVRNRRLGKRDSALLVKDIWREKAANDAERTDGTREDLAEFLYQYLNRRFGMEQLVIEWGYNLHDACERYSHDPRLGIFFGVLTGEVNEELYHSQLNTMSMLLSHLTKVDAEAGNQGFLSKDAFKESVQSFFPQWDAEIIGFLYKCAEDELEAKEVENIEYKKLFMEDDEGKTGPFLDDVRKQVKAERMQYIDEIKMELVNLVQENKVDVADLKKAFTVVDPEIDQAQLEIYLSWALRCKKEDIDDCEPQELEALVERMRNGNITRIGKKS